MAGFLQGAGGFRRGGGPREAPLGPRKPARRAPQVRRHRTGRRSAHGPGRRSRRPVRVGGPRVSAGETELRRGIAVLDQYRAQIETQAQQQEIIRISLEEHMRARETLVRYREAGKAAEVLVPIGANSFLAAQSKDIDKAFVSIGSDLLVYDEMDRQVERLDARIKSITEAANAIGSRLGDLQRRGGGPGPARLKLSDRPPKTGHRDARSESVQLRT